MSFDYEKSIWGARIATTDWVDPASFRLKKIINIFSGFRSGANILEIGCGAGMFTRGIKYNIKKLNCFGCDISENAIAEAKKNQCGIDYRVSHENILPYVDEKFDGVVITDVLEHVDDPLIFLKEIRRVLKSSGTFFLYVPCEGDWLSMWNLLDKLNLKNDVTKQYAGHINFFSRKEVVVMLQESGFNIVKKRYSEHFFGQLLGIFVFKLMDKTAKKTKDNFIYNESYIESVEKNITVNISWLKNIVNWIIRLESSLFQIIPSSNFIVISKKK